jgi:Replication protein C C-terminal region./Replication protein C N-terminal domain.
MDQFRTGLRRLSRLGLAAASLAASFAGDEHTTPGQILAAFKAAAPALGIAPRLTHAVDWLFRFTQPQDWLPGSRPIVWPSARHQADALDLSESQVRRLNAALIDARLITAHDSPNGKRYGRRDARGRIIEAYGFDLSPLAARLTEFRAAAAAHRADRAAVAHLRRRATIARNSLRQTWATYHEQGLADPALPGLVTAAKAASTALRGLDHADQLTPAVDRLEAIATTARQALELALAVPITAPNSVEMRGLARINALHITTTNPALYPTDTVMASDKCSDGQERAQIEDVSTDRKKSQQNDRDARKDGGSVLKIRPDELASLAPALRPYLRRPSPSWPEIVDAADWLRHDLGVSKPLWGEACLAMGRERAAIALALVSTKPPAHFKSTPGGYFHAMVARAKAGTLHLDRSIWSLRAQNVKRQ